MAGQGAQHWAALGFSAAKYVFVGLSRVSSVSRRAKRRGRQTDGRGRKGCSRVERLMSAIVADSECDGPDKPCAIVGSRTARNSFGAALRQVTARNGDAEILACPRRRSARVRRLRQRDDPPLEPGNTPLQRARKNKTIEKMTIHLGLLNNMGAKAARGTGTPAMASDWDLLLPQCFFLAAPSEWAPATARHWHRALAPHARP
ncbi:hypothetical protein V8C35DRAFT_300041 [Trichoderma chlorosporum]